jgi:cytoskeleton protein RodZ
MRDKTIGAELQAAREAADYEISDVAAHLRIRENFLSAIEQGQAEALPGLTYAIGYVRTYAGFLALDPDDAVKRFKQEAAGAYEKTELSFPSPAPEGKVPGVGLMVMAAVLATVAYGGWYVMSERGMTLDDLVPAVPERLAELIDNDPATQIPAQVPAQIPSTGAAGTETTAESAGVQVDGESNYSLANPGGDGVVDRKAVSETQGASQNTTTPSTTAPSTTAPSTTAPSTTSADTDTATTTGSDTAMASGSATAPQTENAAASTASPQVNADMPTVARAPIPPVDTAELVAERSAEAAGSNAVDTGTGLNSPAIAASGAAESGAVASATGEAANTETGTTSGTTPEPTQAAIPSIPGVPAVPNDGQASSSLPSSRVIVRATGDSWIQIVDASGATLFTRILRAGDVYRVPNQSGLAMKTGNAGALTILVDGQGLPSLGETGEVVRNIDLAPAALVSRFGPTSDAASASTGETSGAASTARSGSGSGSASGLSSGSTSTSGTATQ